MNDCRNLQISCVEYLCDLLCFRLDLASFVTCVNSGRSWNSKSSLLIGQKENTEDEADTEHSDPFVENFVLERLAIQSPMRVSMVVYKLDFVILECLPS